MKKLILITTIASTILLTGCGGFQNSLNKTLNGLSSGTYIVTVWSGGQAVRTYKVEGFVNTESSSDGWFFVVNGKLVRISGTITIEQQ
jgi:major membrane immunogen (membrane-anchored lipoprotein)